jgi:hypothetical protein
MSTNLFVLAQPKLDEREAFSNLIDSLKVAETSCKQIAFLRGQQDWLKVEFNIGTFRELVTKMYIDAERKKTSILRA